MELGSLRCWNALFLYQLSLCGIIHKFLEIWISDSSVSNIVEDSVVEKNTVLRNDSNIRSQIIDFQLGDVLTIDQDLSILDFVESVEQSHDG